jgi:hypothetical protein
VNSIRATLGGATNLRAATTGCLNVNFSFGHAGLPSGGGLLALLLVAVAWLLLLLLLLYVACRLQCFGFCLLSSSESLFSESG